MRIGSRLTGGVRVRVLAAALLIGAGHAGTARAQTTDEFFDPRTLHDIHLTMSRRDWQSLTDHVELDTYYAGDLRWNAVTLRNVGIRARGHVTRDALKPGLRIDVNRYLADQRFLGLTAFALDNAASDASFLREPLAMALFNRVGVAAPREAHARVFINDEYAGLYVIVEAIDRTFVGRAFGSADADVERGGFLFEYRWVRPYGFEYLGPDLEPYAELFTPQTRQTDSMFGLFEDIEEMIRAVNDAPDDAFADVAGERVDLVLFMRYLAVENFLAEIDGIVGEWGLHNFFMYRRRGDGRAQIIPWDKDTGFSSAIHPIDYHLADNVLTRRAMATPPLRQIYLDTLVECARAAREWLEPAIVETAGLVRDAVAAQPSSPFTLEAFDQDIERLREFARQRPVVVDTEVALCHCE
jgi:spore coat protein CotH